MISSAVRAEKIKMTVEILRVIKIKKRMVTQIPLQQHLQCLIKQAALVINQRPDMTNIKRNINIQIVRVGGGTIVGIGNEGNLGMIKVEVEKMMIGAHEEEAQVESNHRIIADQRRAIVAVMTAEIENHHRQNQRHPHV